MHGFFDVLGLVTIIVTDFLYFPVKFKALFNTGKFYQMLFFTALGQFTERPWQPVFEYAGGLQNTKEPQCKEFSVCSKCNRKRGCQKHH